VTRPTLLIVDDEPAIVEMLAHFASGQGFDAIQCGGGQAALDYLRQHTADMALIDVRMPNINGLDILAVIREIAPDCAVALMSGFTSVDTAVKAIKLGAIDFLGKPFDYERLTRLMATVRDEAVRRQAALDGTGSGIEFHGMIGRGPAMTQLFSLVTRLAPYAAVALITGETGVGKELVARALHAVGPRHARPLVTVNCSAIVPTLFESELFGHARGAFTGATEMRTGLFEHADGGTVFLDEVGELPPPVQAALLRVLETGEVQRVGTRDLRRVDVRVLAATNRDLRADCAAGRFRQDLYFRLNLIELRVPPLSERREDIPCLAAEFVRQFAARFGKNLAGVSPDAERLLAAGRWDGNVRELRHAVERACMLAAGDRITRLDLVDVVPGDPPGPAAGASGLTNMLPAVPHVPPAPATSPAAIGPERIILALEQAGRNKGRAAELLGVSRRTFYRLMVSHGLAHMVRTRRTGDSGGTVPADDGTDGRHPGVAKDS